jgi:dTDP-4-amino-4,6-dideoxygalactose transaminase
MKGSIKDLALFGGAPLSQRPLHVGRPNVGSRERFMERVGGILDRMWLTNNGPLVQEFESKVADFVGVKHCVATCNATVGLELAIRAAGLSGEVIVPAYTFVATAHALQWQGITPVFCDISSDHNIDPVQVEKLITPNTTGIIGVHLWGRPCNVAALEEIAQRRGLKLLFDAAHAFGCSHSGRMVGGFGLAEVFSFHATKFLNAFEGGIVATNNYELALKVRRMKNFGFSEQDRVAHVGTNGKMTEVSAAMGLTNLESLPRFVEVNRRNYNTYRDCMPWASGTRVLPYSGDEKFNFQYIVVEISDVFGASRDNLVRILQAENVLARKYFWPGCHHMSPYLMTRDIPNTERIAGRVLVLPTGTGVTEEQIVDICDTIRFYLVNARKINELIGN